MNELSLHLLDIAQNSVAAGATLVQIRLSLLGQWLSIEVIDNGRGMDEALLSRVTSPFATTRTSRKVGLGLPMWQLCAQMTGGDMSVTSRVGEGTSVLARFDVSHLDCPPMGALGDTVASLVLCNPDMDFVLYVQAQGMDSFTADTRELRQELQGVALNTPAVVDWLRAYCEEGITTLLGGVIT